MALKKKTEAKQKQDAETTPKKKPIFKRLILVLILLVLCLAASYGGLRWLKTKQSSPMLQLPGVDSKPEIIAFTARQLPQYYQRLVQLSGQLELIDHELTRLDGIEKQFPQQKAIVAAQRSQWNKTRSELANALSEMKKFLETTYVTWLVDTTKTTSLTAGQPELLASVDAALKTSSALTQNLVPKAPQGLLARIRKTLKF
jgi:flagellar basal body-associated protein FliL